MTTEAWRQRAEGRELCDCGDFDEDHMTKCHKCNEAAAICDCTNSRHWRPYVLCRDGSGEFRRARRPE